MDQPQSRTARVGDPGRAGGMRLWRCHSGQPAAGRVREPCFAGRALHRGGRVSDRLRPGHDYWPHAVWPLDGLRLTCPGLLFAAGAVRRAGGRAFLHRPGL